MKISKLAISMVFVDLLDDRIFNVAVTTSLTTSAYLPNACKTRVGVNPIDEGLR